MGMKKSDWWPHYADGAPKIASDFTQLDSARMMRLYNADWRKARRTIASRIPLRMAPQHTGGAR